MMSEFRWYAPYELEGEEVPELPLGTWDGDFTKIPDIEKYTMVINDPFAASRMGDKIRERKALGVPGDLRDLKFDLVPPSHGLEMADMWENVCSYLDPIAGPELPDMLAGFTPDMVRSNPKLAKASQMLDELLKPEAWKPSKSSEFIRDVKNGIVAPYISMINGWAHGNRKAVARVLVVGSWSGADIQRVAIARGGVDSLIIDTYDHLANAHWAKEFRDIVAETFHGAVPGDHFMCAPDKLSEALGGRKYDLILAANSLHQYLNNVVHFDAILRVIVNHLVENGTVLGLIPSYDGFRCLDPGSDAYLQTFTGPEGENAPYGRMRVSVAGVIMDDPVLPPHELMSAFARLGMTVDLVTASHASTMFNVHSHLPYGKASRGYLYIHGTKRPISVGSAFLTSEIPALPAVYEKQTPIDQAVLSMNLFDPRDVGRPITLDDAWFLRGCSFYVGHKTDGVGGIVSLVPSAGGYGLLTMRIGPPSSTNIKSYLVRYEGPMVVIDGEFLERPDGAWQFDCFGLVRYEDVSRVSWYTGISILSHWLSGEHARGRLLNLGMKQWRKCTPAVLTDIWNSCVEGIVLKYACAPPAKLDHQREIGTAKYLKKETTYDIVTHASMGGGYVPHVRNMPAVYSGEVIEVRIRDGVYEFVRFRPDKSKPNTDTVIAEKRSSSTFRDVLRWVTDQSDVFPKTVDLEDPMWCAFLRKGDSAVDDNFRLELAATGCSPIWIPDDNGAYQLEWIYSLRSRYFQESIEGKYDEAMKSQITIV